jgi:hypothetical protein
MRKPAKETLFDIPEDSKFLSTADSERYRSLVQSLMYAATRTYPECLPAACVRSSRFVNATYKDLEYLIESISYLGKDLDHCLTIQPASVTIVASADVSYGVHHDAKSHTGGCVGFKGCDGVADTYFIFSSGKQSVVANSVAEAELIGSNAVCKTIVWFAQFLECFRIYDQVKREVAILYQDNKSTMHLIDKGKGNFKNSKHIRVRYYYIRDLVLAGELRVVWQASKDMVADLLSKGVAWAIFLFLLPYLIGKC